MKYFILILLLSGCGDHHDTQTPEPLAVTTPTPSPTPIPFDTQLAGNWINLDGDNLVIDNKGNATEFNKTFLITIDRVSHAIFTQNTIEIDKCGYAVFSSFGLSKQEIITLNFSCEEAKQTFSYSKVQ